MTLNYTPQDIDFISHITRYENEEDSEDEEGSEDSEDGEQHLEICDQVAHFYDICGHIVSRIMCHNKRNIELVRQAARNEEISALHLYPCTGYLCDHTHGGFVRYVHGSCPDCGRLGLGREQLDNPPINGITVVRSDAHLNYVPEEVIRLRRTEYAWQAKRVFDKIILHMVESHFRQTAIDIVRNNNMFVPYSQQSNPGQLSLDLEKSISNAWVFHRKVVDQRRSIPPVQRRFFYITNQENYTPLLEPVTATDDDSIADRMCLICEEDHTLGKGDPRRLPCGHEFHWKCISEWIFKPDQNTCPECHQEYNITKLPWVSPL